VVYCLVLVLLVCPVLARPYESYKADFTIVERNIVTNIRMEFLNKETGTFYFSLPEDARTIDMYIDNSAAEPVVENGNLKIELRQTKEVGISYVTNEFLDKNNFLINLKAPDSIRNLDVQVTMPEGAVLRKPIVEGDITAGSIHPKPDKSLTDGKSMIFVWELESLDKDEELSVLVQYNLFYISTWAMVVGILVLALLIFLGYKYFKQWRFKPKLVIRPKKAGKTAKSEKPKKEPDILKHLKEDEQQIIRVLQQKGGQCEQGTLRIVTDFSKAHLSRLLMELEARKIIHKEKRGKKNLVFLKK
jgi:hypothetical protein